MEPSMVDGKHDSIKFLEDALSAKAQISKLEKHIAVMFADLCDSTAYKLERGDVEGLLKTYRHNTIVIAAVTKAGGKVVKFIGDEVMATFDQHDACDHALEAALEIQDEIRALNKKLSGARDEEIFSKIGINYGLTLMIQFPGNDAQDPQGKIVDAAARIISLAKPNQILCSEFVNIKLSKTFKLQGPHNRAAKGIKGASAYTKSCKTGLTRENQSFLGTVILPQITLKRC
jgi:class 3 adenylate cyclase